LDGLPESSAWRVRGARRGTSVVLACSASFRWIRASTRPGAIHIAQQLVRVSQTALNEPVSGVYMTATTATGKKKKTRSTLKI
ncbi:hypothetical protein, partial [Micrococcus luteus]|uniref:hypothetical protein n=1 Tax=Micrococcus luteus TaxID=1270 RepID=UPI001D0C2687